MSLVSRPAPVPRAPLLATVSVVALFQTVGVQPASADDLEVSDNREEAVRTSDVDGTGPGDVTILEGASIVVDGQTAVFVDSDNLLTNQGTLEAEGLPDVAVVDVLTGADGITSDILNEGLIQVLGSGDGEVEGPNTAIRLQGDGLFSGDVFNEDGGTLSVVGDGSAGIDIAAPLDGVIRNDGTLQVDGIGATGARVSADIARGVTNNGSWSVFSTDGDASGIEVIDSAAIPRVLNNGNLGIESRSQEAPATATGIFIGPDARADSLINNGSLTAAASGEDSAAFAVLDRSGTLYVVENTGRIAAAVGSGSQDRPVAFDLSANTTGVSLTSTSAFADDAFQGASIDGDILLGDGDDTLSYTAASSEGLIRFEGGNDTLRLTSLSGTVDGETEERASSVTGNISFGAGNDAMILQGSTVEGRVNLGGGTNTVSLTDGAFFNGSLAGSGTHTLTVADSTIGLSEAPGATVNSATFTGDSSLGVTVFVNDDSSAFLDAGASLSASGDFDVQVLVDNLPVDQSEFTVSVADDIAIAGNVEEIEVTSNLTDLLYEKTLTLVDGERDRLAVSFSRRPDEVLGLNRNQSPVLDGALASTINDPELGVAIGGIEEAGALRQGVNQLSPQFSGAVRGVALASQTLAYGVVARRLDAIRGFDRYAAELYDKDTPLTEDEALLRAEREGRFGIWGQQMLQLLDRDAQPDRPGYDGFAVGFALGVDFPLFGLDALGLSFTQLFSETSDDIDSDGTLFGSSSQFTLYTSASLGGFFVDLTGGVGLNSYENRREIGIGEFVRVYESDWDATQLLGSARLGYRAQLGRFGLTLSGDAFYTELDEDPYTEELTVVNEDAADDPSLSVLAVDGRSTSSFRVGARAVIDAQFDWNDSTRFIPTLRGGILTDLEDDPVDTTARFSGGDPFTLQADIGDETTIVGGASLIFQSGFGSLSLDYDLEIAGDFVAHSSGVTFRLEF